MNSFNAILGKFYTLLHNTDPDLSYFDLRYVFLGHNDSVERGPTVSKLAEDVGSENPILKVIHGIVSPTALQKLISAN